MTVQDILTDVRSQSQESNPSQRWPNSQLIPFVSRAQIAISRRTLWPPSIYVFNTQVGVQRYQALEILETKHVYIAGQPIERTDIDTLEGDEYYLYDQSGVGGGPGGFVEPGQPPVLAGGQFTPQWSGAQPATYPVGSGIGIDAATNESWYPGARPRYFFDGGVIGFVPPPAGVYPVYVHCVRVPATVANDTDDLTLGLAFREAMVWKVLEYIAFSNMAQPGAPEQLNYAQSMYEQEITSLIKMKRNYDGPNSKGPKFITYRTFYARGNRRGGF